MEKITVLHTEASLGWGGQEIRVIQEAVRFTELGCRMLIACQQGSRIAEQARLAGLPVYIVRMRFPCDPLAMADILGIVREKGVDLLHTHSSRDSWIAGAAGRLFGIPVIRSRHLSTPVHPGWSSTFVYRYLADLIITSGIHIKEALERDNKLPPGKIVSIAAGADSERFALTISGKKIREELGLENAFPLVGVIAILRSWKGHQYLLEAVKNVVAEFPEARFLIVGNGPWESNLRSKITELGIERYVIMTGFREDIPEIMAALDIFVLPSTASEATSQVIPQALLMGKPVIATNVGGLPELIENGVTGLLIPPGNAEALGEAVLQMATRRDQAAEMARNGRKKILEGYTFEVMIRRTAECYAQVLRAKRGT